MKLSELANGGTPIALALLGADKELALQLQRRLAALGILDPPADALFGPVSHWALRIFLAATERADLRALDAQAATALLQDHSPLAAVQLQQDLASRVVTAMWERGHWLCRVPDAVNIVYLEGIDPDGTANDNRPNRFNDLRMVITFDSQGCPLMRGAWSAARRPVTVSSWRCAGQTPAIGQARATDS